MVLLALDLHLVHLGMISIIPPAWRQGPWRLHLGCHPNLQYITRIYLQHAGHKEIRKTTIWLLPVVILQQGSSHTSNIITISYWPYHITCPCKNKLDASNFLCMFYVARGFRIRPILPTRLNHNADTRIIKLPL